MIKQSIYLFTCLTIICNASTAVCSEYDTIDDGKGNTYTVDDDRIYGNNGKQYTVYGREVYGSDGSKYEVNGNAVTQKGKPVGFISNGRFFKY